MERLTFVDEDGHVLFDNPAGFPEDIGFTIRELAENEEWETLDNIAQRLANCEQRLKYYKDLEEQGKLLKLPCAVGDTVYVLRIDNETYMMNNEKIWEIVEERFEIRHFDCIGITVFLTRPEAEAKLAEMRGGRMATEQISQLDKMIKDLGNKISKITGDKQRDVEEEILRLRKLFESEEKSMLHNVTVKKSERKKLEQYWVARALKNSDMPFNYTKTVVGERDFDHYPLPNEIAQFIYDSKADFVSVVQNYRFEK